MILALFFVAFLQISSAYLLRQPQISNTNAELLEVIDEILNEICQTIAWIPDTRYQIPGSFEEWFFDNCPELKPAATLQNYKITKRIPRLYPQENEIEENRMKTVKKRLLWLKPPKDVSIKLMCMIGRIIIF